MSVLLDIVSGREARQVATVTYSLLDLKSTIKVTETQFTGTKAP